MLFEGFYQNKFIFVKVKRDYMIKIFCNNNIPPLGENYQARLESRLLSGFFFSGRRFFYGG